MTPIEILATIFAILLLVKLLLIIFSPKTWLNIADTLLKYPIFLTIIYFVAAVIVGYYIFNAFTIVQVTSIIFFAVLLVGIGLIPYSRALIKLRKEVSKNIWKAWLAIGIWLIIGILTIYSLFF